MVKKKEAIKKERWIGTVLALLFGVFSYCYTWKSDKWKFWIILGINVVLFWTVVVPILSYVFVVLDHLVIKKEPYC